MRSFQIIFSIFLHLLLCEARKECIARQGSTSPYCVCNTTYCDDLEPVSKQTKGTVLLFETNQAGDRLKETKLMFGTSGTANVSLTPNRSKTYQKIIGFGSAFTDASGLNLKSLAKELAQNVIKDYYSETGIEYNMGRVPLAGADFSTHAYSYDDHQDDFNLTYFKLQDEDNQYKIPYIKMAQQASSRKVKLFGSPWSSPAWMKTNKEFNHGGKLIGNPGEKYYKLWAEYFVRFLDAYKENGIDFWGLTVENEPIAGFDTKYLFNCLAFDGEMQRDFVKKDLGPALEKAGYGPDKLELMIWDEARGGRGVTTMLEFVNACLNDTEASKYIKGIAYHCYDNPGTSWDILEQVHESHPTPFILSTECCQEFKILPKDTKMRLGYWNNSEGYAKDVLLNLQHWGTGWVEWNFVLDMYGQPNWAGFSSEAPVLVNATANEYYKDPKFYVLGHFSKFLSPESVRIAVTSSRSADDKFNYVALQRPDNATVLVVYNFDDQPISFEINDPDHGKLDTKIAAHAVQTYIYWN